jgi:hypothetical protein
MSENEMIERARSIGMDEELISYAKQIQRQLSGDGDVADWLDCLEMSYNEIIQARENEKLVKRAYRKRK